MKKIFLSIIFLFLLNFNVFSHVEHYKKFNYIEYELFRNNDLIGYHKYDFNRNNDELTVNSDVEFNIKKFNINLYSYSAKSKEIYKKNNFSSFSSITNQNKKQKYVNIKYNEDKKLLEIDGSSYKGTASPEFIVGTWWNHEIINKKAQISAISGRIIEQTVTFIGKEEILIGDKKYKTLHFNFKSSDKTLPENKKLNTDIWYEEDTFLWVKAAFDKRGYWEYRIKTYK